MNPTIISSILKDQKIIQDDIFVISSSSRAFVFSYNNRFHKIMVSWKQYFSKTLNFDSAFECLIDNNMLEDVVYKKYDIDMTYYSLPTYKAITCDSYRNQNQFLDRFKQDRIDFLRKCYINNIWWEDNKQDNFCYNNNIIKVDLEFIHWDNEVKAFDNKKLLKKTKSSNKDLPRIIINRYDTKFQHSYLYLLIEPNFEYVKSLILKNENLVTDVEVILQNYREEIEK